MPTELICASYLIKIFNHVSHKKIVKSFAKIVEENEFSTIIGTGFSSLIIPSLALTYNKGMCFLRKEKSVHAQKGFEGNTSKNYIIVDDLVDTGKTLSTLIKKYESHYKIQNNQKPVLKAIYFYDMFKEGLIYFPQKRKIDNKLSFKLRDINVYYGTSCEKLKRKQ